MAAPDGGFTDFCVAHRARLTGMLGLYCGEPAVGEEIAQEALARAWARWPKVSRLDDPVSWVYRVAINLSNSHFRRKSVERRAHARLAADGETVVADETATAVAIRAAISQLPRRKRTALVLRYFADLSYAEIAEVMDAAESTVKSLARRAVMDLRGEFSPETAKEAGYAC